MHFRTRISFMSSFITVYFILSSHCFQLSTENIVTWGLYSQWLSFRSDFISCDGTSNSMEVNISAIVHLSSPENKLKIDLRGKCLLSPLNEVIAFVELYQKFTNVLSRGEETLIFPNHDQNTKNVILHFQSTEQFRNREMERGLKVSACALPVRD